MPPRYIQISFPHLRRFSLPKRMPRQARTLYLLRLFATATKSASAPNIAAQVAGSGTTVSPIWIVVSPDSRFSMKLIFPSIPSCVFTIISSATILESEVLNSIKSRSKISAPKTLRYISALRQRLWNGRKKRGQRE